MLSQSNSKVNSALEKDHSTGPKLGFFKGGVKSWLTRLNLVFFVHLIIIGLVVVGILPRGVVPFWTIVLAVYVLWAPLEESAVFFVRSIPFFIAIPITTGFDSFNTWRILSGLIFLKWLFKKENLSAVWSALFLMVRHHREFHQKYKVTTALFSLLILAILSAIWAPSHTLAIKRIIYFVNLSLIGVVVYGLVRKNQDFSQRLIKNIAIPTIIVAVIGMLQLISTYYMDIFQFVDFWNGKVELGLFGSAWAATSLKANTWFAYFGDQLSLRMFSIFPDSHSFPIFLLLGLPAVMAVALKRVVQKAQNFKEMLKIRASMLVIFVPLIFLGMILTGTRGIWAGGAATAVLAIIFIFWRIRKADLNLAVFKYVSSYLAMFFLLFGLAYYITASNQFEVAKTDSALFAKRVHSLIDISETSNARRLQIWRDSLRSIIKHPLLGVGIGNFPVVVGEDLTRAKAGSSAHNLYLNIAAELGLPTLIVALWFLWLLLQKLYKNFLASNTQHLVPIYSAACLLFIPWILIYSLTDVAIFDERAFLLFVITAGIIFSQKENGQLAD